MCQGRRTLITCGTRISQFLLLTTEEIDFELTHVRTTGRTHSIVEAKVICLHVWGVVAPPGITQAIIIKVSSSKRLIHGDWGEVSIDLTDGGRILRLMEARIP